MGLKLDLFTSLIKPLLQEAGKEIGKRTGEVLSDIAYKKQIEEKRRREEESKRADKQGTDVKDGTQGVRQPAKRAR